MAQENAKPQTQQTTDNKQIQLQHDNQKPLWEFYEKSEEEYKKILETPYQSLSFVRGSQKDKDISQKLEEYFSKDFITSQQLKAKKQVLSELEEIIKEWSDEINRNERNIVQELIPQYRARLLPFGSYCLGVSSAEGDIDLVVVAPHHIDRKTHFDIELLKKIQENEKVTKCKLVSARNPIITFYYDGQAIDISLGKLDREIIPENIDEQFPDEYLRSIDQDQDINALNGRRNNMDCLSCVGHQKETYRAALKALKIWYKAWGLSPNRLGYFGGIDVAILVGKICQMFPNLPLNRILEEFFRIYSQWDWENVPVKIKPFNPDFNENKNKPSNNKKKFNYDYTTDKHKPYMVILTPSAPCINSIKATHYTQRVIHNLLNETNNLIQNEINTGKKDWFSLFEPYRFFDVYKKYIEIDILGNQDKELFEKWKDTCEVKMLQLYQNFDKNGQFFFHPFPKPLDKQEQISQYEFSTAYFIGVKKKKQQIMEGQRAPTRTPKLNIKNTIKESFLQKLLEEKKRDDIYNNFSIRVFQTQLKELIDIDFGDIYPQELKETKALKQKRKSKYNKDGFDENYSMQDIPDKDESLPKNKRKGPTIEKPVKKIVKKNIEIQKQASQQEYDAADEFL